MGIDIEERIINEMVKAISDIPVSSPGYQVFQQETLRNILRPALLEQIAKVAYESCRQHLTSKS